jgi:hypothetical protein
MTEGDRDRLVALKKPITRQESAAEIGVRERQESEQQTAALFYFAKTPRFRSSTTNAGVAPRRR